MTVLMNAPVGIQTPRISLVPPCNTNAYEEAHDLAAAYGLTADEWQTLGLRAFLGELKSGLWAAPRCGLSVPRQNGKNGIIEMRELFGMVILGERILHTAHEVKTSLEHFRRMKEYFERHDDLRKLVHRISNTNGSEAIYLTNGGRIQFIARSKSGGRGFSADLLVLDEAQELDDDKYSAILPTISASPNPQQILTGTPPGPKVNGEVFTRFRDGGVEGKDTRLVWLEWSADPNPDLDDIDVWAQANPALGIRLAVDTIADERAAMGEEEFARERLGMWSGIASHSVIDMEHWATLASVKNPDDPVAFAIDVSPNRDMASIGVAGYIQEKVHVQAIENRKGTGWIVERLKELDEKWKPCAIVIDAGSPAASLLPDLKAARIKVYEIGGREMGQACGAFYDLVQQERLLHADQPALNAALAVARKRNLNDAWAWHRKDAQVDITPLVSVTLAAHGLSVKRRPKTGNRNSRVILMT